MTREELIHITELCFHVPCAVRRSSENRTYHCDEIAEAKRLVMEMLEQEPCEDCISRQAALKAIEGKEYKFQVYEAIKMLPPVALKQRTGYSMVILKDETYQDFVNTYTTCVTIDDEDIKTYGAEHISEFAVKELSHELAKCITSNMEVHSRFDIYNSIHNVYGTIKVVKPVNNAENWKIK